MTHSGVGVGDLDVELGSSLDDLLSGTEGHSVSNLGSVCAVVHQKYLKISYVVYQEGIEMVGAQVLCLLVGTIPNLDVRAGSLETTTHTRVNTLGRPPCVLRRVNACCENKVSK